MEKYYSIIKNCALFNGVDEKEFAPLMQCLGTQIKHYQSEEYVFFAGDKVNYIGILIHGTVEIMKENLAGNKHIVAMMGPSEMFAEGIVCTATRISPVTVRTKQESVIMFIPYEKVIRSCGSSCEFHIRLIQNMMIIQGERNIRLNRKLELLTLKGMRQKLVTYLLSEGGQEKGIFEISLNRTELADYLNVARTSMCRELTRMKEEGLIDFYGNNFKLLEPKKLQEFIER